MPKKNHKEAGVFSHHPPENTAFVNQEGV